jgi:hypothetical protein
MGDKFGPGPIIRKDRGQRGEDGNQGTTLNVYGSSANNYFGQPATLFWWNWTELKDKPQPYSRDRYADSLKRQVLSFPQFDDDEKTWKCHYAFQPGGFWVGRFNGVKLKPVGEPKPVKEKVDENAAVEQPPDFMLAGNLVETNEHWVQFEFKNDSGKNLVFWRDGLTLVHPDNSPEVRLGIPESSSVDKELESSGRDGCVAHSPEGSMYRPVIGSKVRINWKIDEQKFDQLIELPEFDPAQTHWYCYFTLDSSNMWTATFEGTKSK